MGKATWIDYYKSRFRARPGRWAVYFHPWHNAWRAGIQGALFEEFATWQDAMDYVNERLAHDAEVP